MARPRQGTGFRLGDIIVTAVSHHYAIGRMRADGMTQDHLASEKNQRLALAHACEIAGTIHRVFLYRSAGDSKFSFQHCRLIQSAGRKQRA
jgi:hypothetical protein